jgi:hypothetical protein
LRDRARLGLDLGGGDRELRATLSLENDLAGGAVDPHEDRVFQNLTSGAASVAGLISPSAQKQPVQIG